MALGPTQPPIQWVPGALSLGVKRPEREADHSSTSSTDVSVWSHTSAPQCAFMAWCSVTAQGQLCLVVVVVVVVVVVKNNAPRSCLLMSPSKTTNEVHPKFSDFCTSTTIKYL
jgi:hypothetical protein